MKKNTLTIGPIMLEDELWMRQWENPFPNHRGRFCKPNCRNGVFVFWTLRSVLFGSIFRKPTSIIFIVSTHPYNRHNLSSVSDHITICNNRKYYAETLCCPDATPGTLNQICSPCIRIKKWRKTLTYATNQCNSLRCTESSPGGQQALPSAAPGPSLVTKIVSVLFNKHRGERHV